MVESMMLTVSKEGTPNVSCHQFLPQMASTQHVVLFVGHLDNPILIIDTQNVDVRLIRSVRWTDSSAQEKCTEANSTGQMLSYAIADPGTAVAYWALCEKIPSVPLVAVQRSPRS